MPDKESRLNTLISVINHCLQWLYKCPQPWRWWLRVMATGDQCGVWNRHTTLELKSDKHNLPIHVWFFFHKPLSIMAVQGPQPRRWWLQVPAIWAQWGVWNRHTTLELTSDKQNYPKHGDFCHKPLPIIAVQCPQPRRWWLRPRATGTLCGVWNQHTMI